MKDLVQHWVHERWRLFQSKETGIPYTSPDYRMNQTRFCNVHRENDKVTRIIRQTWAKPTDNQDDLPMVCLLARRINLSPVFNLVERPTDFTAAALYTKLKFAQEQNGNRSLVGPAYRTGIQNFYAGSADNKRTHAWAVANLTGHTLKEWIPKRFKTLEETHKYLMQLPHVGSFMSAQVVADLKHTEYLKDAPDWWTWAAVGPGSERGLNRYFTGKTHGLITPKNFLGYLNQMSEEVSPLLDPSIPRIGAQDWQNIMCEFDKYLRFYDSPNTGKVYRSR